MKRILQLIFTTFITLPLFAQDCTELFFSEYVEGPANNNGVEIYNPSNNNFDLSAYSVNRYSNGSSSGPDTWPLSGTVGICAAIMNKYNVDTVPHIICGGFNKEETENALIDLDFLGIDNVLVLRGDPIKSETYFNAEEGGHKFASGLLKQVDGMNNGVYLDEELKNSAKTDFCIGVAGYPEKHFEAANIIRTCFYLLF